MSVLISGVEFDGYWMDAEYYTGYPIKIECDIWAFGFLVFELVTKKIPFIDFDKKQQIKKAIINHELPEIPNICPPFLKQLILKCWTPLRENRITAEQIVHALRHNL